MPDLRPGAARHLRAATKSMARVQRSISLAYVREPDAVEELLGASFDHDLLEAANALLDAAEAMDSPALPRKEQD